MSQICIVFDHPYTGDAGFNEPHNRSFSAALLAEAKSAFEGNGDQVDVIDLHKDEFDPVMHQRDLVAWRKGQPISTQIKNYQERLKAADQLVFIFPIWWEAMPAMTKGFFDKVIAKNIIYDQTAESKLFKNNLPNIQKIKLITTMSTPEFLYRRIFGNPITKIIFRGTFRKMGINHLKWFNFSGMDKRSLEQRRQKISDFGRKIIN